MKSLNVYSLVFFLYKKRLLSNMKSRILEFPKVNKTRIKQNKVWTQTNDQFKRQSATHTTFRTLVSLEPKVSIKACRTCKIIMHIQSPGIIKTVYSNISGISRHIQEYWRIFSHTHRRATRDEKGEAPLAFLKIEKKCTDFFFFLQNALS